MNRLWDLGLSRERLAQIGLKLGADVPFFVFGRNAFAEGVGEVLAAVDVPPAWYLVLTPQVSVPTQEIFTDPGLTRDTKPVKIAVFFADDGSGEFRNDLEPVAVRKYPAVGRALEWLAGAGRRGRMSGSGASVFAVFGNEDEARRAAEQVPSDVRAFVVERSGRASAVLSASLASSADGESPSWLRHRILIPTYEGSNPSSPAKNVKQAPRDGADEPGGAP